MKNKSLLSILLFFLFSNLLNAQINNNNITKFDLFVNRADSLMSVDSLELVLSEIQLFTKEQTNLNESQKVILDSLSGKANADLARKLDHGYDREAIEQYKVAMVFFEKIAPVGEVELAMIYKKLGSRNRAIFNYKEAKKYLNKSLTLLLKTKGEDDFNTLVVCYNLAAVFQYENDYGQAHDYLVRAIRIANNILPEGHTAFTAIYELKAHNDVQLHHEEEAIKSMNMARDISLKNKDQNPLKLFYGYNMAGRLYADLGRDQDALENYQKGLKILRTLKEASPLDYSSNYGLIAIAYSNLKDFEKADEYIAKAYKLASEAVGEKDIEVVVQLTEWGFINLLEQEYEQAERRFKKAALDFGYDPSSDLPYENISDYAFFLDALIGRGTALMGMAENNNNKDTWLKAEAVFVQAADVLSILKTKFNDPVSKLRNIELYYELFEKLIDTRLQIYEITKDNQYIQQAVAASEESKAYILLENFKNVKARKFSGIPDSLLVKEDQLKRKYDELKEEVFDAKEEEEVDQQLLADLQEEIFSVKQELNNLINYFKNNHDNYFKLKYQKQKLDFPKIQNSLMIDESLVEYFVGDSAMYVFHISHEKIDYQKIKMDFPLRQWTQEMQEGITAYHQNEADQSLEIYAKWKAQYQERAYQLYEKLLSPFGTLKTKLILIPDGNLWYLPFEAMLTQQYDADFRNAPYLLYKHSVSYQYAINLWLDGKQNTKVKNNILAVAPIFESTQKNKAIPFRNLRFNQEEVEQIAQIAHADLLKKEAALKSNFLAKAKKYGILHLATHAQLNNDNNEFSFLAFAPFGKDTSDWKLYVNELYNMELTANLVVLSACDAGTGDWQRGEGLTSLGRGFTYAGAKNIVSTLWKVNDQSTANIMTAFYQNLKDGLSIDKSLQESKLAYIKAQKEDRLANPFYWAAFTTLGNTASIDFEGKYKQYVFIFASILLMFLSWYIWRRKNS